MTRQIAQQVISRMHLHPAMLSPTHADLIGSMRFLAEADPERENANMIAAREELTSAYGYGPAVADKPFAFADGVAVIPVHGVLINRFGGSWGFVTGYNFIRTQMNAALADPDVDLIAFDMNSPGGEVAGCFELAADIRAARESKPILAVVDSSCYSACYAIGSAATKLVVTPTGGAGSIGVLAMHANMKKMLDDVGVEITYIFAGEHKVDGNPYEALPDEVKADLQAGIDATYEQFIALVASNRGLDAQAVRDTQARCYRPDDALRLGLIDAIVPPSEAVGSYFSELTGSDTPEEPVPMTDEAKKTAPDANAGNNEAALTAAKAEGAQTERQRIEAITTHEEAADRPGLANHLAFHTDMSVEASVGMLKAAAKEAKPNAVAPPKADSNQFRQAMDKSDHPNVGADSAVDGDPEKKDTPEARASRILDAQQQMTGNGVKTVAA